MPIGPFRSKSRFAEMKTHHDTEHGVTRNGQECPHHQIRKMKIAQKSVNDILQRGEPERNGHGIYNAVVGFVKGGMLEYNKINDEPFKKTLLEMKRRQMKRQTDLHRAPAAAHVEAP